MRIQITEGEYKTLKGALRRCDAGTDSFATDCFLLGLKLVKARNYSQGNKIPRGVLQRKKLVPKKKDTPVEWGTRDEKLGFVNE